MCADLVQACWKDQRGKSHRASALLEDISASGACLQTETALPAGAAVQWRTPKAEFRGIVRYCEYREIGYFVGVEFDPRFKWSKKSFQPRHLLDVNQLMRR